MNVNEGALCVSGLYGYGGALLLQGGVLGVGLATGDAGFYSSQVNVFVAGLRGFFFCSFGLS